MFLRSVSFCPDECLIWTLDNTKNGYFPVFQVTNSYIISSALWTLFICVLSLAVFPTSKNLTESESDLSKAMSDIQATWLSRKLIKKDQYKATDFIAMFQEEYLKLEATLVRNHDKRS